MSLFTTRIRPAAWSPRSLVRRLWRDHLHRKAARDSLERLLAGGDDHLLDDVGVDRGTAHHLIGETLFVPHRSWDRWQG